MRIDEITINIPIKIDLDNGKPSVKVAGKDAVDKDDSDDEKFDQNPVMISPQQQELELKKSEQGKDSPVIDKMTDDDEEGDEEDSDHDENNMDNLRTLAGIVKGA
jgi:hypothetical protein